MDIPTGFEDILQVDGYTNHNALAEPKRVGGKPLTLACCWVHSRRKNDVFTKGTRKEGGGMVSQTPHPSGIMSQ